MDNNDVNEKELANLTKLLLDIDVLNKLESRPFNVFDVLKISRTEIRHSNVLAWLIDPYETHGMGYTVLSLLNSHFVKYNFVSRNDAIDLLTMKYSDIVVYREWKNIDILVESKESKYILCIENKIDTAEHSDQLNRYYEIIQEKYKDYTQIYLYLTPEGLEPVADSHGVWGRFDYESVVNIVEQALNKNSVNEEIKKFIESYCEILRREIMNNNEIVQLCQKIYKDHKEALDLIYENRPDRLQNVSEIFKLWCEQKQKDGKIHFDSEKSSKSYTHFRTDKMDTLFPKLADEGKSGWNTDNHYFYEISATCDKDDKVTYAMQLSFSAANLNQASKTKIENVVEAITNKKFSSNKAKPQKKSDWQWKTAFKTESKSISSTEVLPDFNDKNIADFSILKNLDKMWKCFEEVERLIEDTLNSPNVTN